MNNTMFAQTFRTKYLEQMKKSSKTRLDYKTFNVLPKFNFWKADQVLGSVSKQIADFSDIS